MICNNCGYTFILDPKLDGSNDLRFTKALKNVSNTYTSHYTFNQFYAEFNKMHKVKISDNVYTAIVWIMILSIVGFVITKSFLATLGIAAIVGTIAIVAIISQKGVSYLKAHDLFHKWQKYKPDTVSGLISKTTLHNPPTKSTDSDIYDYGVEAIIFVDTDLYVDLFVLNDLHTDLKALVVSKTGYPYYLQDETKRILSHNPETPVFMLHNAMGWETMEEEIRTNYNILDREIIDLGLFTHNFQHIKRLKQFSDLDNKPFDVFNNNEILSLLTVSLQGRIPISESAGQVYPNDDVTYGSFG
ncbi:MAG: hypothetical protein NXI20_15450 [bacterium]|nr:hypothetical protein [bacterium]